MLIRWRRKVCDVQCQRLLTDSHFKVDAEDGIDVRASAVT